ncbi:MAG: carboxymuconolactone decarboxylase family protein [Peptococcaceae bacterium]|jgi:AhpD family alkylhydroperoxidase|nr:carboxymuconolactone decarboxylase family protein [Peptococcaceae bacterium]
MEKNPVDIMIAEAPELFDAYSEMSKTVFSSKGLDEKTKQLIYMAMRAAEGDAGAVKVHAPMAKAAGATRDEVKEAILMTLLVSGMKGVVSCLPAALVAYDQAKVSK